MYYIIIWCCMHIHYCQCAFISRVHISKATFNVLKDLNVIGTKYVVEDGYGMERSDYLTERNIITYFITRKENVSSLICDHFHNNYYDVNCTFKLLMFLGYS